MKIDDFWDTVNKKDCGYEFVTIGVEFNLTGDEPHDLFNKIFDYYFPAQPTQQSDAAAQGDVLREALNRCMEITVDDVNRKFLNPEEKLKLIFTTAYQALNSTPTPQCKVTVDAEIGEKVGVEELKKLIDDMRYRPETKARIIEEAKTPEEKKLQEYYIDGFNNCLWHLNRNNLINRKGE